MFNNTYLSDEDLKQVYTLTPEKCKEIAKKDCRFCVYSSGGNGGSSEMTCVYILRTKHRRPCFPGDCRQKGVFKKKENSKISKLDDYSDEDLSIVDLGEIGS